MALHSPTGLRERLILMGGPGSGKTRAYLDIAHMLQKTGSDSKVYVIDTDYVVEYQMATGYPHLTNLEYVEVSEWGEYTEAMDRFQRVIKKGDWLVGDLYSNAWESVQEWYTEKAYGKSKADHFIERKKEATKVSDEGFSGSSDWGIIKPEYASFSKRFFFRHPGHVIAICGAKVLSREGKWKDSAENIAWFDHIGFRPEGEKRTAHHAHAVLHMKRVRDEWLFTTAKDRERGTHYDVGLGTEEHPGSFTKKYLLGIAGWRL